MARYAYTTAGRLKTRTWARTGTGVWTLTSDQRYIYDGWNLIAALSSQFSVLQSFAWRLDLSRSLQGSGRLPVCKDVDMDAILTDAFIESCRHGRVPK